MTDRELRADGAGFYLAGGELTVAGAARQAIVDGELAEFSITADLFGGAGMDVVLAGWKTAPTDTFEDVRSQDGCTVLSLHTQPVMLNSLPGSILVHLRTAHPEGTWRLVLHFRNRAGSRLVWQADLPSEAFGAGWLAPLADLMTIDGTDPAAVDASTAAAPTTTVVHHADDEYYELLVDGQQAGLLVYHVIGSQLSITHTVIEPTYRHLGLSWVLIGGALDDIRTRFTEVSNYCPVVRRFVEQNPDYRDLLRPSHPVLGQEE